MAMATTNQTEILSAIPNDSKIAIALDYWLSQSIKAFIAITSYFFTEFFEYQEVLLGFKPLHDAYNGKYLAEIVIKVLIQYNLLYRVIAVTTDDALNNNTMMQEWKRKLQKSIEAYILFCNIFNPDIHDITESTTYIPYLAHVIQLAVHTLLDQIKITAKNNEADTK